MVRLTICCLSVVSALGLAGAPDVDISSVMPTRLEGWGHEPRYKAKEDAAKAGGAPIVFLGDDHVEDFELRYGRTQWVKYFKSGRYRSINLGFRGDRTENVLWRIENGELTGYKAKAVVLEIGTRNLERDGETVIDTILGVRAVVRRIRELQPSAKVILHPILPRGEVGSLVRAQRDAVNKELKWLADGKDIWWCDFNDQLLTADRRLLREVSQHDVFFLDYAYEVWANALLPYLDAALDWNENEGRLMPARLPPHVDPSIFGSRSLAIEPQSVIGYSYAWEGHKGWWLDRVAKHRKQVAQSGGKIDVVFLGDSITDNWDYRGGGDFCGIGKEFSVLNLGYSGDRTQHLLWRVRNGELDGYKAKVVILMIGTNNRAFEDGRPENVAAGIRAILDTVRAKQPQAKVILHPIFPCGPDAKDAARIGNAKVSNQIRPFADGKDILWCDFNERLMEKDGTISKKMMPDFLHPGLAGYEIWRDEVLPIIRRCVRGK